MRTFKATSIDELNAQRKLDAKKAVQQKYKHGYVIVHLVDPDTNREFKYRAPLGSKIDKKILDKSLREGAKIQVAGRTGYVVKYERCLGELDESKEASEDERQLEPDEEELELSDVNEMIRKAEREYLEELRRSKPKPRPRLDSGGTWVQISPGKKRWIPNSATAAQVREIINNERSQPQEGPPFMSRKPDHGLDALRRSILKMGVNTLQAEGSMREMLKALNQS